MSSNGGDITLPNEGSIPSRDLDSPEVGGRSGKLKPNSQLPSPLPKKRKNKLILGFNAILHKIKPGVTEEQFDDVSKDEFEDDPEETCPICFEEKKDIKVIPHWDSKGDISGHKLCGDCAKQYTKNDCPFCHEVSLKDELMSIIEDFVHNVSVVSSNGGPNELAALMEHWQFFEMEYGSNPKVIHRVAKLVLQDTSFKTLLENGVKEKSDWMRDAAGVIFRLYSLSVEGDLDVMDSEKKLLADCYSTILEIVRNMGVSGHHYGAIYSQAMVPYICAFQSGQRHAQLGFIVTKVGNLIVTLYNRNKHNAPNLEREIKERIVEEYMPIVSENVWGGKTKDPVWKAFY